MSEASVSIVVPTRNGMRTLPALLTAIARQRVDCPVELVAVDSGSTDGTVELLQRHGAAVIGIQPDEFDHGLTRNLGIERSHGELVVLIVQDALPATDGWLAELIAPLRADPAIAGVFGRQSPRPEASALTRYYVERAVAAGVSPRILSIDHAELTALPPGDRLARCTFDNVCSCIRRSVWRDHPFRQTRIAEDIEWAIEIMLAGHRLAYVPGATVVHSHERSPWYEFARTSLLHRRLFELLGLRTVPTVSSLARSIASSMVLHVRCETSAPPHDKSLARLVRAVFLAVAWPLGQYLGPVSAVRGWKPPRWRNV
jgi:rhamnosyltransferase